VSELGRIPPPGERRRRNREEVAAAILDAAHAVMRERGVAGLSLHEVARRVGMRAPSLYEYFPSKAALYDTLFRQGLERLRTTLQRLAYDRPFWEGLEGAFEAYHVFVADSPELYQLVFERPVPGFVPSEESMAASRELLSDLQESVANAIARGEIDPPLPVPEAADLLIALLHGLTSQQRANEPDTTTSTGRYTRLAPTVIALLRASWTSQ
jgi:AcrR family transcriptional regulator